MTASAAVTIVGGLGSFLLGIPLEMNDWRRPAGFEEDARALATWLDATKGPETACGLAILKALANTPKRIADQRATGPDKILQDVALQRTPGEAARYGLELLARADGAFYHAWCLAESLRIASDRRRTPMDNQSLAREEDR